MPHPPASHTDVLIIGAGPSGLIAAYWMARCGVNARIIDKRGTKVFTGQADGLRSRTMELFDSMGIQHRILQEGCSAPEFMFWGPGENGKLERQYLFESKQISPSPYYHTTLSQGRVERFILDAIKDHSNLEVERGVVAESLDYDESLHDSHDDYPIRVTLRTLSEEEANPSHTYGGSGMVRDGLFRSNLAPDDWEDMIRKSTNTPRKVEIIKAKYMIGCDGAHSWTRKQLNIPLEGSTTEHIWGVVDMIPITDFPDIRRAGLVSTEFGTMLIVPRERQLVRIYLPLQDIESTSEPFDRSSITLDMIRKRAQHMLKPFHFDFKVCDWWTTYQVGQRLAPTFSKGRIYLAGDAVHTHSPKVGLGMNISMQDGFNIGWKVALVANKVALPSILDTYESERQRLGQMLIEFDRQWTELFTRQNQLALSNTQEIGEAMTYVAQQFETFADGMICFYGDSPLVKSDVMDFGQNLLPGERFIPAKVRSQADGGRVLWTTRLLESDGRFRIVFLAGDIRSEEQKARVFRFSQYLASANSVLRRYTPHEEKIDRVIEVVTIHSAPVLGVELFDFPEILHPFDQDKGWDYDKVWSDDKCSWDQQCNGKAYETWGVDRLRGAVIALRPDQYIGWIGELEDFEGLAGYFEGILEKSEKT